MCGEVTSLAEVWIEIGSGRGQASRDSVTSLAEVWIEIFVASCQIALQRSLPLRKCGLKSRRTGDNKK